jgi:hypothetical protein
VARRFDIAAALTAAALSSAASITAAAQTTNSDEIVVTVERLEEIAQSYAGAVAVAPAAADQYARWNFRLCPSVAGLGAAEAQTLIDHIALRTHEVGVDVQSTGCSPNLIIIFAPDSDQLAREIVTSRRDLLGYYSEDDVVTAGRDALDAFANTPRAVRWWHVSRRTTADGQQLGDSRTRTGRGTRDAVAAQQSGNPSDAGVATIGNGFSGMEGVRSQGTRLRRSTRQDLSFALMVVDARRVSGLPPQAVADYLAMATLVQLDPHADMSGFPTILNLFSQRPAGEAPPAGMTEWDRAYLQGLYGAEREAASTLQQRNNIARLMAEQIAQH